MMGKVKVTGSASTLTTRNDRIQLQYLISQPQLIICCNKIQKNFTWHLFSY